MKKQYTIGIDIGGTNIKAVLFNGEKAVADSSLGTPQDSLEHLIIMILALLEPLHKKALEDKTKIKGAGVGVAGLIDLRENRIVDAPNLSILNNVRLAEVLEKRLGLPVKMDNDAECFLRAEMAIGAGVKYKNAYGLTLGTGIGGAWWMNGDIYYGTHGISEPSRMIIDFNNGTTLESAYKKLVQNNPLNMAVETYRGDELARRAYEEVGRLLGLACVNIIDLIDPEAIILGGGVMASADLFLPTLKSVVEEKTANTGARTKMIRARLGQEAGAIGAALLID